MVFITPYHLSGTTGRSRLFPKGRRISAVILIRVPADIVMACSNNAGHLKKIREANLIVKRVLHLFLGWFKRI